MMRLVYVALLVTLFPSVQQTPARDGGPAFRTGTALISGTVLIGDTGSAPARRARVVLKDAAGLLTPRVATTDDDGTFEFREVPAGRFTIEAVKAGFLTARYGTSRPNRAGTPVAVGEGGRIADVTIRLRRGAVIAGTVRDARGRPLPGVQVSALRFSYSSTGDRALLPGAGARTDDRGEYRIWGLIPGDYLVMADPIVGDSMGFGSGGFDRLTSADVDRGLAGSVAAVRAVATYAPVFHPASSDPALAAPIVIKIEEERAGVDITVAIVPAARVGGTVRAPDGGVPGAMTVTVALAGEVSALMAGSGAFRDRTARTDAAGVFGFADIPTGRYSVIVKSTEAPARAMPTPAVLFAAADVDVRFADVQLSLDLRPAMKVTGRIAFDGASPAPDPSAVKLYLVTNRGARTLNSGPPGGDVRADGTFEFTGVTPGQYRLVQVFLRPWTGNWSLKTATAAGRNALDGSIAITAGEDVEWTLVFTDRPTQLVGRLEDATGRPATDYFLVLFPADPQSWDGASWRVRSTRPASDGQFSFVGLPPGNYLLAAVTDLQDEDLYTPSYLRELSSTATPITLAEGEKKRQDMQVRGGQVRK